MRQRLKPHRFAGFGGAVKTMAFETSPRRMVRGPDVSTKKSIENGIGLQPLTT